MSTEEPPGNRCPSAFGGSVIKTKALSIWVLLCINHIPFRAGVLTQGAGHFPEVIEHHPFERPVFGIIQKAADVRAWAENNSRIRNAERDLFLRKQMGR